MLKKMDSEELTKLTIQQLKDKYSPFLPNRGWKSLKKADMIQYVKDHLSGHCQPGSPKDTLAPAVGGIQGVPKVESGVKPDAEEAVCPEDCKAASEVVSKGSETAQKQVKQQAPVVLDQFYTKPEVAKNCRDKLLEILDFDDFDIILEPSAGSGSFFNLLPASKKLGIDLDPKADGIIKQDFFEFIPDLSAKYLVIGNPPFGRVSSLAVKFFNKAAGFAGAIAFIIPRTFKRISIQNRLDLNFHLVFSEDLPLGSFEPSVGAKCCFQVWIKKPVMRTKVALETQHEDFTFVSKQQAEFALRSCGSNCGTLEEINLEGLADRSWNWIKSSGTIPLEELKDRFRKLDFSLSRDSVRQDSLGHSDLIMLYQEAYSKQLSDDL
jgi:hypothetical protein